MNPYILLATGWIVYFFLHSFLATEKIKRCFDKRKFRLFYSLVSIVGLFVLLFLNGSIQAFPFFKPGAVIRYASLALTAFGVILLQITFKLYNVKTFIGLEEEKEGVLITTGVLGYIRHPIYAGIILITLGFFLFIPNLPTLVTCVCILLYLPIGIYLEERKLIGYYGEAYREYRRKVPMLIPKVL